MNPNLKLETRSNLLGSFKMEKKVEKTIFFFRSEVGVIFLLDTFKK